MANPYGIHYFQVSRKEVANENSPSRYAESQEEQKRDQQKVTPRHLLQCEHCQMQKSIKLLLLDASSL